MKIAISFIGAIVDFFASLVCPTWDCTQEDFNKMKIVKGNLPDCSYTFTTNMPDDIRLDDDLSLYSVRGIPQKR